MLWAAFLSTPKAYLNSNNIILLTCIVFPVLLIKYWVAISAAFLSLSSHKKEIKWVEVVYRAHHASFWDAVVPRIASLPLTSLQVTLLGLPLSTGCLALAIWAKCCRSNTSPPPHASPRFSLFFFVVFFFSFLKEIIRYGLPNLVAKKTPCLLYLYDHTCNLRKNSRLFGTIFKSYCYLSSNCSLGNFRNSHYIREQMLWVVWCMKQMQGCVTRCMGVLGQSHTYKAKCHSFRCS